MSFTVEFSFRFTILCFNILIYINLVSIQETYALSFDKIIFGEKNSFKII